MILSPRSVALRRSPATLSGEDRPTPQAAGPRVYHDGDGLCVGVRVSPSAPRTELRGLHGDRLKVAVNAPPEDNRANKELEEALAGWLGMGRHQLRVLKGHASRDKVVAFTGSDEAVLRGRLEAALEKFQVRGDVSLGGSQGS